MSIVSITGNEVREASVALGLSVNEARRYVKHKKMVALARTAVENKDVQTLGKIIIELIQEI
jgi:hypothetical protein